MRDPIEYQHFANLVERVSVYTERLENVCKSLEQYKVEIKTDMKDLDGRVRRLEDQQNQHNGKISGGWIVASILFIGTGWLITNFLYYKMGLPTK